MPCSHGHSHGDHHAHEHADCWTNLATLGEGLSSFASDAYWLGMSFQLVANGSEDLIGLSYYAFAFGIVMALLSAGGAVFAHRALNQQNQNAKASNNLTVQSNHRIEDACDHDQFQETNLQTSTNTTITPLLLQEHMHAPEMTKVSLPFRYRLALLGDFISHAGDIAGPLTFVIHIAAGHTFSRSVELTIHGVTAFAGGLFSVANVRTCKRALENRFAAQLAHR